VNVVSMQTRVLRHWPDARREPGERRSRLEGRPPVATGLMYRHKKPDGAPDDAGEAPKVDCDALADPNHLGHREAVKTIAHVDDGTHEPMLTCIEDELEKFEPGHLFPSLRQSTLDELPCRGSDRRDQQ
jgi:hypothetical protein